MKTIDRAFRFIFRQRVFVRNAYGETLLENFLVSAVASVLIIRLYLRLTDYPQIGGKVFHISHMLFGGLLMLIALFILLGFLGRSVQELASVIGGIGFGAFIDELGKFITRGYDYFFEPTVALIYITFVLLFLLTRTILRRQVLSPQESLANAFEIGKQACFSGLDTKDREFALELLEKSLQQDHLVECLRTLLLGINPFPPREPRLVTRARNALLTFYQRMITKRWFTGGIIGFFAFTAITNLYEIMALVAWSWAPVLWLVGGVLILLVLIRSRRIRNHYQQIPLLGGIIVVSILMTWAILVNLKNMPLTLIDYAQYIFPGIYGVLVVVGMTFIRRSRLEAYLMFRRAMLVSILLIRVMAFYEYQFFALLSLFFDILILLALRYMISQEELKQEA